MKKLPKTLNMTGKFSKIMRTESLTTSDKESTLKISSLHVFLQGIMHCRKKTSKLITGVYEKEIVISFP